jgi:hypothetical protein
MKHLLLLSLALLVAASASAVEGFVLRSATAQTNPAVYFPAALRGAKIVSFDATGVEAADKLSFAAGTIRYTALKATAAADTNIVFLKNTLASNDVMLVQNSTGLVVAATGYKNTLSTNKFVALRRDIGTNLAVGQIVRERLTTAYTLQGAADANDTVYYFANTNNLDVGDFLVLYRSGNAYSTSSVASLTLVTNGRVQLKAAAPLPVAAAASVYAVLTNRATVNGAHADDDETIRVTTTNGFAVGDLVLVETAGGNRFQGEIDTAGVTLTNLTLVDAAGFTLATGDVIYALSSTVATTVYPEDRGATSVLVTATNGLVANTKLLFVPTAGTAWRGEVNGTPALEIAGAVTASITFGAASAIGDIVYEASGTALTTTFAAASADRSLILSAATGLVAGDPVIIFTGNGPVFDNTVSVAGADYALTTMSFAGALGIVLAAGDYAWLLGSATDFTIGAATVSRDNASGLWGAGGGVPVRARLTSTNGTIHNITSFYNP